MELLVLLFGIYILLLIKNRKISLILIGLVYILFYTFRVISSIDDVGYQTAFDYIRLGYGFSYMEPTFNWISKLVLMFSEDIKYLFFIYASISIITLLIVINKIIISKVDLYIFFTYFTIFSVMPTLILMRQFAAIAIVSLAFVKAIKDDKLLFPIILILLAFLFHKSAIFMLPFLLIIKIKVNPIVLIIIILTSIILGILGIPNIIISYLGKIGIYEEYSGNYELSLYGFGALTIFLLVASLINLFLQSLFYRYIVVNHKLTNLWALYLVIYTMAINSGWASRLSLYFIVFIPIIFIQIKNLIYIKMKRETHSTILHN